MRFTVCQIKREHVAYTHDSNSPGQIRPKGDTMKREELKWKHEKPAFITSTNTF